MKDGFFSKYPQFFSSSPVGNWPLRLNARYEVIIEQNRQALQGARVLDIASHDGRWAFAELEAGAEHVTGIEVRPELLDAAEKNMKALGMGRHRYCFEIGDVFERSDVFKRKYDVVMCLGFLYHTARHEELFDLIRQTHAKLVVVDTGVSKVAGNFLEVRQDVVDHPAMGDSTTGVVGGKILVARPTRGAVQMMLGNFGYQVTEVDWASLIKKMGVNIALGRPIGANNPLRDYGTGGRTTFYATLSEG